MIRVRKQVPKEKIVVIAEAILLRYFAIRVCITVGNIFDSAVNNFKFRKILLVILP